MTTTTTTEAEEFARLALGSRALKNRRVRRAIIARLLNENGETYNGEGNEEPEEGTDDELVRALIASRMLRRRRVRRALLAHLFATRAEGENDQNESEDGFEEEGGGDETDIVRALVASRAFRRRRVRRALVAHLLEAKAEGEPEHTDGEFDEGSDDDQDLVKTLIASRILRRKRVRRALLAHLFKEGQEATN